jgi:hypothetical protein
VYDLRIWTLNLMHTARLSIPLDHQCTYSYSVLHGVTIFLGFLLARHLPADVRRMRHIFRFVRSPPLIEFTAVILFWNNETERRAQGPSSAARERNRVHSLPNTKNHALSVLHIAPPLGLQFNWFEINQQLKQEFGRIAVKRSRHVHVIQTCFGRPLIGCLCFAVEPWTGRKIFVSLNKNVGRKAWLWKGK